MSDNLFKDHSISAIEACLSKALTELLGHRASLSINNLELSSDTFGTTYAAKFSAYAVHEEKANYGKGIEPI